MVQVRSTCDAVDVAVGVFATERCCVLATAATAAVVER